MIRLTFILLLSLGITIQARAEDSVDLLIVAGQSNAVGYDAKPTELPADPADREIMFWWRVGDPPPDEHDSTSGGKWTFLQHQPLGNPKKPRAGRQYGNFAQAEGGFGPEIGLARTLYRKNKQRIAVVKAAFSGTGMRRDWNPDDPGDGRLCYSSLVSEIKTSIAAAKQQGITLRPRAFIWVQGESDANASDSKNYANALGRMIASLRNDIDAPQLASLIAVNTKFSGGRNKFMPVVVEQQKLLARRDPYCEYVDTSDASVANHVHYDAKGTLDVGSAFANSLLALEGKLNPKQRRLTIVTLGDSITKAVRSGVSREQSFASLVERDLNKDGRSVSVINVGIGGERTDQALRRLQKIIDLKPDLVTIMYGTNDSYVDKGKTTSRISVDAYRKNLVKLTTELLRRGIVPVLMTEPRWSKKARLNGIGENPNLKLQPYVEACRQVANEWRVPFVDHFAEWTKQLGLGVDLHAWTTDGCHPNPAGHKNLAATMLPVLRRMTDSQLKARNKLHSGQPFRVVCFGDSVTGTYYHSGSRRAYTDMLRIALRRVSKNSKVEAINAGISGHTTVNGLKRIDNDVLKHKPDLVTVMFGLNDMTRVSLEDYQQNLKTIVEKCRAIGAEVVLATPNSVKETSARPSRKLIRYCDAVRQVGRELNVPVCDAYREFNAVRTHDFLAWRTLMSDPIHPNMDGHKRIAIQLAQVISGHRITLDDVGPLAPLARTKTRIAAGETLRVLAMPPLDRQIAELLKTLAGTTKIEVTAWEVEGKTLEEIKKDAASKVRRSKPDLVLIAVPRMKPKSPSDQGKGDPVTKANVIQRTEAFVNSYAWIMNWSLNFGPPTWDVVVVHPSVNSSLIVDERDDLIRQLVRAQDLSLVDRAPSDSATGELIFERWLKVQLESK